MPMQARMRRRGYTRLSRKLQANFPKEAVEAAGLRPGDELRAEVVGHRDAGGCRSDPDARPPVARGGFAHSAPGALTGETPPRDSRPRRLLTYADRIWRGHRRPVGGWMSMA